MNKLLVILLSLLIGEAVAQQQKKVVYIIVDGIAADVIEQANTPNLTEISRQGTYMRAFQGGEVGAYNESPTISAVGYNNVLTGVWYNKHNVPDNDIKSPNYNYPSIFRLLKDAYPQKKIGVFSSWQDNRTKLIGEGLAQTGNIKMDYAFDGLELDTNNYPHDKKRDFMAAIDEAVSKSAAETIEEKAPDLSWVYLEYTDDMGHMYGDSPQYTVAIEKMDKQVGRIWQAIKKRQASSKEEWMIIITTDHGRDEATGQGHGGQSFRQRSGWIISNKTLNNSYAKLLYPSAVDILPTIAQFMDISIPENTQRELDGIKLIGEVAIAKPQVNYFRKQLDISWMPLKENGEVKIWVSTTNNQRKGEKDTYQLMGTFPLKNKNAVISVKDLPSSFYKIVLETNQNMVNRWVGNP